MYAAVLLVATAAVGVDTGWRPAQDDPQSVQYIIQIEPEVIAKMLRDGTPIDSIVSPEVPGGVIRCFRVQLGEEELPREMPEVAKATYEAPVEANSATLRKVEAMELSPAPSSSTASTATPPLNALAADMPQPRYSNTLSGSGAPSYPNGAAVGGTPLNPVRTANAADTNPALGGTASNFSIPGGSTTTPVAPTSPSRFNTTPLPAASSSSSTTYQNSGGYSSTPVNNAGSEYPAYSPPPLNNNNSTFNNSQTPLGGNTASDPNYQRFGDNYTTPNNGSTASQTGNYNNGQGYSAIPNSNNGSYNNSGLTPINSPPQNQNSQNNNGNSNNGNMVPPSNQQQPNQNYQQPPANNYQQPYPQQQPFPYGQPGYAGTPPYAPAANPYYPAAPGYAAPYSPYVAALPPYAAPPAQQTPPPAATPTPTPTPSPSDRPARDREFDEEKSKIVAAPVERPYWMLVIVAFLSLGFNIYMGWMVVDFRTKYRDILAGFRELKAAN